MVRIRVRVWVRVWVRVSSGFRLRVKVKVRVCLYAFPLLYCLVDVL